MILYFSGTGNSRHVALELASLTSDTAFCSTHLPSSNDATEVLGLVFPVYAWGIPQVYKTTLKNYLVSCQHRPAYVYMVCTCGDDIGLTDKELGNLLEEFGLHLAAAFSLQMPNTYVCLPFFDVDTPAVVKKKLETAAARIPHIAEIINRRAETAPDVTPGAFPWLKSRLLRPTFQKFLMSPRRFSTDKNCTNCGKCTRVCPLRNIKSDCQSPPVWGENCAHCLACYHSCHRHAINYGTFTRTKGQYLYPVKQGANNAKK